MDSLVYKTSAPIVQNTVGEINTGNPILDWAVQQIPVVFVLSLVLWRVWKAYEAEKKYNKELVRENISLMKDVFNTMKELNKNTEKNEEKSTNIISMLQSISSKIEHFLITANKKST